MKKKKWIALALVALLCLPACSSHGSTNTPGTGTSAANEGTVKGQSRCKACGGTGFSGSGSEKHLCSRCGGTGYSS